jgi:hypothetical protein
LLVLTVVWADALSVPKVNKLNNIQPKNSVLCGLETAARLDAWPALRRMISILLWVRAPLGACL